MILSKKKDTILEISDKNYTSFKNLPGFVQQARRREASYYYLYT